MADRYKGKKVRSLRAHHVCCIRFWQQSFAERGPAFAQLLDGIKAILSQPDTPIMVSEGIDELCHRCPDRAGERCNSPLGSEDEVRKWDSILMRELGLPFGSCLTASEWQSLVEQKVPFKLCRRCQWRQICSVGRRSEQDYVK